MASHASSSTSERLHNQAYHGPKLSTGQTPLEYRQNRSQTADRNVPYGPESDTRQSLWDRAYANLETENSRLVEKYEKLLSRVLSDTSVYGRLGFRRPLTRAQMPIQKYRKTIRLKKVWTRPTTASMTRILGNVENN